MAGPTALSAIDGHHYTVEPRLAVDAVLGGEVATAFNDVAVVRFPGQPSAVVAVWAGGHRFVSYAADAKATTWTPSRECAPTRR